jgi:N(2)-fixation sustaining protein CowN
LYLVCSNSFYLDELFEKAEDEEGIRALNACELECC